MSALGNSLLDMLDDGREEEDDIPSIFHNSPYFDNTEFINVLCAKKDLFSLITLNCQSLNAKFNDIYLFLQDIKSLSNCSIGALCLQETWLDENCDTSLLNIPGYTLISKGKSCSTHGGTAIYLNDEYDYKILSYSSESNIWDGLFIEIEKTSTSVNQTKKLIIGNIYRPPRNNVNNYSIFIEELNEIMVGMNRFKKEVVIVGDFNLDLLKIQTNNHIKDYFDMIIANGFVPKITHPTRLTQRHGSLIDNIFLKLSVDYSNSTSGILWNHISDHQPCFVLFNMSCKTISKNRLVKVYTNNPNAVSNLKNELSQTCALQNFDSDLTCNPNITCNVLMDNIISALNKHLPVKTVKFKKHKHKKSKWITNGIMISIRYRDRLYADLHMTDIDDASYHQKKDNLATYNRILKQNIRLAKKQYYHSCFEKFKDDIKKTWSSINEIMNRKKIKKDFPKLFRIDDMLVSNKLTIANEFNKYFGNVGKILSESVIQPQNRSFEEFLTAPCHPCFSFNLVTSDDIVKVIDQLKPKNSCGIDGLSNKLLKVIKHDIIDGLTIMINQCLTTNIFPDRMKLAKVVPLHKKNDNDIFDNYRPISLLPSISKIIERLMHVQILSHFDKYNLMFNSQYGFRPNHSTELAALEVIDQISCQMDKNEIPINLFLDLSKAFDCLNHDILLFKLKYYGFQDSSFELMKSYLSNRRQYVSFDDVDSEYLTIDIGVPQGSILGPLLFLIYINDIQNSVNSFRPIIYADDTTLGACLSYFGNNMHDIETNINTELSNIHDWLKLNRLNLNLNKTKAMVFHTNRRTVEPPKIYIDDHEIDYVGNFNYLGIILDKHLSWDEHTNMIRNKITKLSGILNKLKHLLPQLTLKTLYNTLVSAYLNYGILVWGSKSTKLEKIQKKLIRIINCAKYNSHTDPLFKKMSLLKVSDIRVLRELTFCYKLENDQLPYYFSHSMFSRHSSRHMYNTRGLNKFQLPLIRHTFMKNTLRYRIPHIFNSSNNHVIRKKYTHSLFGFKKYVKNNMISNYQEDCRIRNCYICQNTV